jgi:UDP-N-acetylmuramoyl-L-alanyl-D-glutamate--2,6-diaminopimelate ligase
MQVVGITGTNGKTTTAFLMASIFEAANSGAGCSERWLTALARRSARRHTRRRKLPRSRAAARECGIAAAARCAMEVSSHALSLHRAWTDRVSPAGVFTNLTRDHLDFHADMERISRPSAAVRDAAARRAEPDQSRRSRGAAR